MSIEAIKQALDALGYVMSHGAQVQIAKDILTQAIEQAEKQKPVAWISDSPTKGNGKQLHWTKAEAWRWSSNITPLYTAPPKKQWVGLKDEEIVAATNAVHGFGAIKQKDMNFAKAIEAKLREKNHG